MSGASWALRHVIIWQLAARWTSLTLTLAQRLLVPSAFPAPLHKYPHGDLTLLLCHICVSLPQSRVDGRLA